MSCAAKGTRGLPLKRLHETNVKSKFFKEDYVYPIDFPLSNFFLPRIYDTRFSIKEKKKTIINVLSLNYYKL